MKIYKSKWANRTKYLPRCFLWGVGGVLLILWSRNDTGVWKYLQLITGCFAVILGAAATFISLTGGWDDEDSKETNEAKED